MSERADMPDDLAQAYAKAQALAGDGAGPSAAVRANVLAAARAVAAEAAARAPVQAVALSPVAPPVTDVGSGRPKAINLSSWRVRSGAALAAMLLVGVAGWRFDATRRLAGGEQVAVAELRLSQAPTTQLPHDLPMAQAPTASMADLPPPVVDAPPDGARSKAATQAARDKDVVVAQLDQPADRARAAPAPLAARRPEALAKAAPPAADVAPAAAPQSPPVQLASNAADARDVATQQEPAMVTIKAAPTQMATTPAMPPSVLQRRVAVVPPPAPAPAPVVAPQDNTVVAAATPAPAAEAGVQRVEVDGQRLGRLSSTAVGASARKSASDAIGSLVNISARALPPPLVAAADRGDVDALRQLLADRSTPVDAPDATGRSALLHAVLAQQAAVVRLLLAAGADPARADQAGLTPRAAAQAGASAEIAALLGAPR